MTQPQVHWELVFEFFCVFSRFEFALKAAEKCDVGENSWVEPNWDVLGEEIDDGQLECAPQQVEAAMVHLENNPPKKQKWRNGAVVWETPGPSGKKFRSQRIFKLVKDVRNNLFHGGKYAGSHVLDPARDEALIQSCLVILEYGLHLAPDVARHFAEDGCFEFPDGLARWKRSDW